MVDIGLLERKGTFHVFGAYGTHKVARGLNSAYKVVVISTARGLSGAFSVVINGGIGQR